MMRPLCQKGARATHREPVPPTGPREYSSPMTKRSNDFVESDNTAGDIAATPATEGTRESASAPVPVEDSPANRADHRSEQLPDASGGKLGSAWVVLVLGALVTILVLIFIAQNTDATDVRFLGVEFSLPLGVLILFAAIAGALIMALFAGFRILQLRMRARKARKLSARAR